MGYIKGVDRGQIVLFPERLDDLVSEDNPVRVIDEFINQLDLEDAEIEVIYPSKAEPVNPRGLQKVGAGRPGYSPKHLLKLYIYGYFKKVRSSRKLMELCRTNIEVMWLLGRLDPDFRTISDFRKDHAKSIKKVFRAFTRICIELGLYSKEIGVQDGSKFRAVNSKDNCLTKSKLPKKIEMLDEKIEKYFNELDRCDKEERDSQEYTKEEIAEKIKKLKERREIYNEYLKKMDEEGITQISLTDKDARLMKMANGGFNVCYNTQIIVDPESHIVGDFQVTNKCNDMGLLNQVTQEVKEALGVDVIEVVADKGYEDNEDMLECIMSGTIPHVPSVSGKESYDFEMEHKEAENPEELLNSTEPEDIKACLEAGVLPNAYEGKGIEASIVEKETIIDGDMCFKLNEDGTAVICPQGFSLGKVAYLKNKGKTRFASRTACKNCKKKCTTSKFKQVDLKDGQTELRNRIRGMVNKVKITLTPDKEKIKKRKCVVEHPFGTVKRSLDGSYFLLIGEEKVTADSAFLFLAYNIKRAINMLGVEEMIRKMRELKGDLSLILIKSIKVCINLPNYKKDLIQEF